LRKPTTITTNSLLPLLASLLLAAPLPAQPSDPQLARAAAQIRPEAIAAHMTFLADDLLQGRDTGSEGHEIAARYVASQFQAAGLQPAGDSGSWFQRVPFVSATRGETSGMTLRTRRGEIQLTAGDDYRMSVDFLRENDSVEAPLVFAGFGVTAPELGHDDYRNIDVKGSIVVIFQGAPESFPNDQRAHYSSGSGKAANAAARGAVGLIQFRTPADAERVPWSRGGYASGSASLRWIGPDGSVNGAEPNLRINANLSPEGAAKLFAAGGHKLEAIHRSLKRNRLRSMPLGISARVSQSSIHGRITSPNVVALLPGSDPEVSDETIVFVAHLDHLGVRTRDGEEVIYNGAYDNASGVAALIEMAHALGRMPERPRRSIVFLAATAEEKGLLGADYFAAHPTRKVVAAISLDMFLMLYPVDDIIAIGAEHSSLDGVVERAASETGFRISPEFAPEEVLFIRTDHYPFVKRGVPGLFVKAGLTSRDGGDQTEVQAEWRRRVYHSPNDKLDQIFDFDSGACFARLNMLIGWYAANADEAPQWKPGNFFGETFGR
jgi:hypothetical protein